MGCMSAYGLTRGGPAFSVRDVRARYHCGCNLYRGTLLSWDGNKSVRERRERKPCQSGLASSAVASDRVFLGWRSTIVAALPGITPARSRRKRKRPKTPASKVFQYVGQGEGYHFRQLA